MPRIYDELTCSHIPCAPRDPSFVFRRVKPKTFGAKFSGVDGGRFSWVCKSMLGHQEIALKVLKKTDNCDFQKELDILTHLGLHPNVVNLVAICDKIDGAGIVSGECLDRGIVLPWHSGGSLQDFIKRNPEVISDDKCLRNLLLGICRGVEAVHKQKVVHRDIACRNFLVSGEGRIILSDFGLSRRLLKNGTTIDEPEESYQYLYYDGGGVLPFRSVSPESLSTLKFTMRSDIWSLGVLAIDLARKCQSTPFGNIRSPVDLGIAFASNPSLPVDQLPSDCPLILRYFVEKCCELTPELRPPIEKLVHVAWTPKRKLQTMVSSATQEVPPADESKDVQAELEEVDYEYSTVPSSGVYDEQGIPESANAPPYDERAVKYEEHPPTNLSVQDILHLSTVLREHKFDDSMLTLLTDEDMNELHSKLGNASDLKAHIRTLQDRHKKPRVSVAPVRWWKRLSERKKPKKDIHVPRNKNSIEQHKVYTNDDACKVILVGASQTGKSTLFKYLYEYYGETLSEEKRSNHKLRIYGNSVAWMQALIKKFLDQEFPLRHPDCEVSDSCREAAHLIQSAGVKIAGDQFNTTLANAIEKLWADDGIRTCFEDYRSEIFQMGSDNASYFFDKVGVLADNTYVPSFRDCMMSCVRTAGIEETSIAFEGLKMSVLDPGGTRSGRKKWTHVFSDDKPALICVAALSEYDEVLFEDNRTNCMAESLKLFEQVMDLEWGPIASCTLLLTKEKLFEDKLKRVPLTVCFPDYQGANEYSSALEFIKQQFQQRIHGKEKVVHIHVTDLLDSNQLDTTVWTILKEIVTVHGSGEGSAS